jgi:hypothetical protein
MSEKSRRFTDREVAMVLHKASEIDEAEGDGSGSGLSLEDLTEIAKEVGISSGAIHLAVAGLDRRRPMRPTLAGAPLVRKAVHAIPGELNEQAIERLVRLIDERAEDAGTISEALGSMRWTSSDRFKSTRISITPGGGETSIEVVEKVVPRMRRIVHLVPAAWASMFAGSFVPLRSCHRGDRLLPRPSASRSEERRGTCSPRRADGVFSDSPRSLRRRHTKARRKG